MIDARTLVDQLVSAGYQDWLGIPCSYLSPLFTLATRSDRLSWHPSARETDALAYACGLRLGGRRPVLLMQNSGLLASLDIIASLQQPFQVPVLMIISLRGDPMGQKDAEHHQIAAALTESLLEQLQIPARRLEKNQPLEETLTATLSTLDREGRSAAILVPQGVFAPIGADTLPAPEPEVEQKRPSRLDVLQLVASTLNPEDLVVTTTGHTTREFLTLEHAAAHFPMVGSMGAAAALGAGWSVTGRPVTVLDGDGSFLMGLSAAPQVARAPGPLRHIILDNGIYASTGSQSTGFESLSLSALAHAAGYPEVYHLDGLSALHEQLTRPLERPTCLYLQISDAPSSCTLPRPQEPLAAIAGRFLQEGEG